MIDDTNKISESIRNQLMELGVEPAKAHAASLRCSTIESAANWVFTDGENVSVACLLLDLTHSGSQSRVKLKRPLRDH